MQELVAQGVEPGEHDAQHHADVVTGQCSMRGRIGAGEALLPVFIAGQAIFLIPVGLKDVLVGQKNPNGPRIPAPYQLGQPSLLVQAAQAPQEFREALGLNRSRWPGFGRVRGIEADPEKDEAPIIIRTKLSSMQPTQRPVDAQSKKLRPSIPLGPLPLL